uniref:Uncharacterized protein n=1 Tax=Candidatus Nitrotoga fabula TaxID=2182327 RepID=A0A2X0SMT3_9PROT|nr:protein of unknown function [Candidatus Nitrotoga fabula]
MKIQFLTPVWHGADCYREGDSLDIDDEEAIALIHLGVAEAVTEGEEADPPEDPAEVPADVEDKAKK